MGGWVGEYREREREREKERERSREGGREIERDRERRESKSERERERDRERPKLTKPLTVQHEREAREVDEEQQGPPRQKRCSRRAAKRKRGAQ